MNQKDADEFNGMMGTAVSPEEKQGLTDNALIHHGGGDAACGHSFQVHCIGEAELESWRKNGIPCPKCGKIAGFIGAGSGD